MAGGGNIICKSHRCVRIRVQLTKRNAASSRQMNDEVREAVRWLVGASVATAARRESTAAKANGRYSTKPDKQSDVQTIG
jgi:hypothetical protein